MQTNYYGYLARVRQFLSAQQIITSYAKRYAYGTDASCYRLTPALVLLVENTAQVIAVIQASQQYQVALTFRAAGTSLSGQAVTDAVLVMLTDSGWQDYKILANAEKIYLQAGIIGAQANLYLRPYQRKIGPDPASINSCKIAGIVANNASGMCCGTVHNSYHTLAAMTFILADGTLVNTADSDSVQHFRHSHAELLTQLSQLAEQVKQDSALYQHIKRKYRLKNTSGYGINALIDFTDPVDILQHLLIGSEGTLGFIADITYYTVADYPDKAAALYLFNDMTEACQAVSALAKAPVDAVEIMDWRALQSVAQLAVMPDNLASLAKDGAGLLIETRAATADQLSQQIAQLTHLLSHYPRHSHIAFTTRQASIQQLWQMRKAMFPAVGATRPTGTTVIIEDVAFPVEQLAAGVRSLQQLLVTCGYQDAIIFGHALAGNLHFVFSQSFANQAEIQRYDHLMQGITQRVALEYGGSIKAEHGTGRNMAPFVATEWGDDAYQLMKSIKSLIDPKGILNPGVIINNDSQCHLKHLKTLPATDPLVDQCIECGYCEPVCPSRGLTLTPRQRIALWRHLNELINANDTQALEVDLATIIKDFNYLAVDSCAATGLCAQRCPVDIDTGALVRKLRADNYLHYQPIARWLAQHFSFTTQLMRGGLAVAAKTQAITGDKVFARLGKGLHQLSGKGLPLIYPELPRPAYFSYQSLTRPTDSVNKELIYFPSCVSRTMGPHKNAADQRPQTQVFLSLLAKAGWHVKMPDNLANLCCGMPFNSKGFTQVANRKSMELQQALADIATNRPVVFDTSPCAWQFKQYKNKEKDAGLEIYDLSDFLHKHIMPELHFNPLEEPVMLHLTCSTQKLGNSQKLQAIAQTCAQQVIVGQQMPCCGFAGDKGFTLPALNAHALRLLPNQVPGNARYGFSTSRTCEIGLSKQAGIPYQSILYLVDWTSL
jgi:D-lactate dehydrogenase